MFETIIGHGKVLDVLRRQVENGALAHAYLFVGPESVGKTAVASVIASVPKPRAKRGGKQSPEIASPASGVFAMTVRRPMDEKTGKLKSAISVEQIREMIAQLSLTSFDGQKKTAFIEEADHLSDAAGNALLKTLEEPRGDTLIILRAESVESVPATMASRCQILRFYPVATRTMADALVRRGVDGEEATRLALMSAGRPGVALRFLKDGEYRAEVETAVSVFETVMASSLPKRFGLIAKMLPKEETDKATALSKILDVWERVARDKLLTGDQRYVGILDRLRQSRDAMDHNINPQLALEHIIL